MPDAIQALTVSCAAGWATWLAANAAASPGVWLTLAKKTAVATAPTSLTYAQALDEALCHGWIDGQARAIDALSFAHRFQPRTRTSTWSKRNVGIVARLHSEGRMLPAGIAAVDAAKADGRWERAYAGSAEATPPPEFLAAVEAVPAAAKMYEVLSSQNRYAIYWRLHQLKTTAGRDKAIARFVEMLARGETVHPQKRRPQLDDAADKPDLKIEEEATPAPAISRKRPKEEEQEPNTGEQAPRRRSQRQGSQPKKAKR
ncbi:hypothetical protein Dda_0342 [Drechslerella dactyloides]|uniref:Bacteriocin-protection protein n=1 Tax=Drechslerella dactyloides TaxID=74499 RepID=A0AAD6J640_DREDA|nr:hypothetical protein Dda_0342 [Drechslerella dactyloides]